MRNKAFIILFFIGTSLCAQFQFKIDDHNKKINMLNDSKEKVEAYLDLSDEYYKFEKINQFHECIKKAELLASKLNYTGGRIRVILNYGRWHLHFKRYSEAEKNFYEALDQSKRTNNVKVQILTYLTLFDYYAYLAENVDQEKSWEFLKQSLQLSIESKDTLLQIRSLLDCGYFESDEGKFKESIGTYQRANTLSKKIGAVDAYLIGLNLLGLSYYELKDLKTAIDIFNEAFDLTDEKNEEYFKTFLYNNIGICLNDLGLYEKSVESYLAALKLSIAFADSVGMSTDYFNLADTYLLFEMHEKALEYYTKALDISEEIKSPYDIAYSYNGLATYYSEVKEYPIALEYYEKSIALWEKLNDKIRVAENLIGIAEVQKKLKKYEKSYQYYSKALMVCNALNLTVLIGEIENALGELYLLQKDYVQAETHLKTAYSRLKDLEIKTPLLDTYKYFSSLYSEKNDFQNAFLFQQKYLVLKDTFYNKEKKNKIIGAEIKYELAEKNRENELLKKENEIQNLELEKTSNLQLYFTVISVLAFLIAAAVLYSYRMKVKANKNLKMLNGTKDKFISIISHDIKNPIYSIMAYSDLMISDFKDFSEKEVYDSLVTINNSSKNLHKYLNEILTWQNAQKNELKINPDRFNLYELVQRVFSTHDLIARQKEVTLVNELDKNVHVLADRYMIEVIVTNLVNNAIKFTNAGGQVAVRSFTTNNKVEISVVDNGIGIPKEDIHKLFRIDESYSSKGTQGEEGTGLGLILCKEFVEKNGGEIHVKSTVGKGSSFIFTLPAIA
ncbi:MAG: tetratricopeptide repeat-containing sensor histidine kinase [bacterium]